jgi:cysteine synthase A|tara:strand:+ start:1044 stop:1934 length:891 start_codon:yes stop_codon:yes gene_type:complete
MVSRKTAIGNTALVEVDGIYAKLECANPCGSIKDRMVRYILDESEKKGFLKPGMKIIEATSGNTGISLAYFAKKMGYDVTIVMPVNMTEERKQRIRDLGAHLTLCSEEGSFAEAVSIRDDILSRDSSYFNLDQFSSPLNVECHYTTTGQEILKEHTLNPVEAFVAGVGTGGSLLGTAKALKKVYPDVHIAAVEPSESAVMSGGKPGIHGIPGIGDGFIPAIVKGINQPLSELINEVICVSSKQAQNAARRIREDYGLPVGISSGANYLAAKELFKKFGTVVTLFPDGSVLYGSLGL